MNARLINLAHRQFSQDRSLLGALVESLTALSSAGGLPAPGAEIFLPRPPEPDQHPGVTPSNPADSSNQQFSTLTRLSQAFTK